MNKELKLISDGFQTVAEVRAPANEKILMIVKLIEALIKVLTRHNEISYTKNN